MSGVCEMVKELCELENYEYVQKGETVSINLSMPKNSKGEIIPYSAYTIGIRATKDTIYDSIKDKINIGTPSEIRNEYGEYSCTIPIENVGTAEIQNGELLVYFWKGTECIGVQSVTLAGIVGGETTEKKVTLWNNQSDIVPDYATVDLNYANIETDGIIQLGENRSINYEYEYESEVNQFSLVGDNEAGDQLILKLKYVISQPIFCKAVYFPICL